MGGKQPERRGIFLAMEAQSKSVPDGRRGWRAVSWGPERGVEERWRCAGARPVWHGWVVVWRARNSWCGGATSRTVIALPLLAGRALGGSGS